MKWSIHVPHFCLRTVFKQKAWSEIDVAETELSEAKQTWICRAMYQTGGKWVSTVRGCRRDFRYLYGMVPQVLGLGLACICQERNFLGPITDWLLVGWDIKRYTTDWAMVGEIYFLFLLQNTQFKYLYYSFLCVCFTFVELFSLKREIKFISISLCQNTRLLSKTDCTFPDYTNNTGKEQSKEK